MLVGDIYGGRDYASIGLSATTIASSFGKVVGSDKRLEDYSKAGAGPGGGAVSGGQAAVRLLGSGCWRMGVLGGRATVGPMHIARDARCPRSSRPVPTRSAPTHS